MRYVILMGVLALSACVTTSQVVPAGVDTYMVSAANDACGNCEPAQIRAAKQAAAFCEKSGRVSDVRNWTNENFDLGYGRRVTMLFGCVTPSNPKT